MRILICDYDEVMDRDLDLERGFLRAGLGEDIAIDCYVYDGNEEVFFAKLAEADVLMTAYLTIDARVLSHAKKLKMISVEANGYNSIDIAECKKLGITVACIEEYCTDEVADHTLTLALSAVRKINEYQNDMRNDGIFRFNNRDGLFRLSGKTWGIVGAGKIGKAAAKRAQAFGCKIVAYDPFADSKSLAELGIELVSKEELFARSNIISLHAGYTKETHHFINKESIALMAQKPIIVNVSRGGLV
ncbi:MAG: NAD(P)-dependent oxidoreductase, partial [Bacillota bacterium]